MSCLKQSITEWKYIHGLLVGLLLRLFRWLFYFILFVLFNELTVSVTVSYSHFIHSLLVITVSKMIKAASVSGLSPDSNDTADGFWKFTSSSVFAATVVTTIGEELGNITFEFDSPV